MLVDSQILKIKLYFFNAFHFISISTMQAHKKHFSLVHLEMILPVKIYVPTLFECQSVTPQTQKKLDNQDFFASTVVRKLFNAARIVFNRIRYLWLPHMLF